MSTYFQSKEQAESDAQWLVVDAAGKSVGRVASTVAALLRGKHKPQFTKHVNGGDFVIVVNASQVRLTGNKMNKKMYYNYSGFIGGLREQTASEVMEQYPERVIEHAVAGMLPDGALGHRIIKKLHVYAGTDHKHASQKPKAWEVK